MKFESTEEFEMHVHKCFSKIFELLQEIDRVATQAVQTGQADGNHDDMANIRDWVEDAILHCHLAWQYHRLSIGPGKSNTWERLSEEVEKEKREKETTDSSE